MSKGKSKKTILRRRKATNWRVKSVTQATVIPVKKTFVNGNLIVSSGASDDQLAELVMSLREQDRLCLTEDAAAEVREPQIICSLGLFEKHK